jgi:hypothetical protein
MGKEVSVSYFKALSQHLHGWTEVNHETSVTLASLQA